MARQAHPPNDLPACDLQRDFNARLLAAWDGACAGAQAGLATALASGAEDAGLGRMLSERAARATESAWIPTPPSSGPPSPRRQLTRQSSTPNRFWETSASAAGSTTSSLRARVHLAPPSEGAEPPVAKSKSTPAALI